MFRRAFKLLLRLALLVGLSWLAREALKRWVQGPAPKPSSEPWPPLPTSIAPSGAGSTRPEPTASTSANPSPAAAAATTKAAKVAAAAAAVATTKAAKATKVAAPTAKAAATKATKATKVAVPTAKAAATKATKATATVVADNGAPAESWVPPGSNGTTPESHPVKVKIASRLYHLPGMAAYQRTTPDRCYASAEAAEADGFTRAKR